jgi:hypothetical protein
MVGNPRAWLMVIASFVVGLSVGSAAVLYFGRTQSTHGANAVTPSPRSSEVPSPSTPSISCILWSPQGDFNVTITGDHSDHDFPGYCAVAKQKLAMHEAGPAAGAVTCDMSDQGISFVFRDTGSRTYFPCDRAAAFFEGIRG